MICPVKSTTFPEVAGLDKTNSGPFSEMSCNSLVASVSSSAVIWSAIAVSLAVIAEFCVICSASKASILSVFVVIFAVLSAIVVFCAICSASKASISSAFSVICD
ncbi:hypothetical protein BFP78_00405 [Gaetbulibacter sp. 5U11]|nr:hypothetical protein BFP78_00405 [Gaetbulibacter sp. 5U11]